MSSEDSGSRTEEPVTALPLRIEVEREGPFNWYATVWDRDREYVSTVASSLSRSGAIRNCRRHFAEQRLTVIVERSVRRG